MTAKDVLERLAEIANRRTAFIGLGNRDRGDDAVGLRFIDDLRHLNPNYFFSEEQGLESVILGIINDQEVDDVIFVDSCDLYREPGEYDLFSLESVDESISTHKVPVSMLMALIQNKGKNAYLLGIQPRSLDLNQEISEEIIDVLHGIEKIFLKNLKKKSK
ncbi:MAG: hydrogenase maturation protease [Thermoplasmata archaeon]|nr:hydrogenase maturation protease [Thermoplasmata archaeon]